MKRLPVAGLFIALAVTLQFLIICPAFSRQVPGLQHKVPVLCYHNIKPSLAGHLPEYTIDTSLFIAQIKMLHDSGYNSITPDQLYSYLERGSKLPVKPILISFDDTREEHFAIAGPVLQRFNFKGLFFIMTVSIGKPGYMSAAQIKQLSDDGHTVGLHTWNHPDVRTLSDKDWDNQLARPGSQLSQITGLPVKYFAYPSGLWNEDAIAALKKQGIQLAFQLSGRQSETNSQYTIQRIMVSGGWTARGLYKKIITR